MQQLLSVLTALFPLDSPLSPLVCRLQRQKQTLSPPRGQPGSRQEGASPGRSHRGRAGLCKGVTLLLRGVTGSGRNRAMPAGRSRLRASVWGPRRGCCLPDAYSVVAAALCTGVFVPPLWQVPSHSAPGLGFASFTTIKCWICAVALLPLSVSLSTPPCPTPPRASAAPL